MSAFGEHLTAVARHGIDTKVLEAALTTLGDAIDSTNAKLLVHGDGLAAGVRAGVRDAARVVAFQHAAGPADYTGAGHRRQAASLAALFARPGEHWLRVEAHRHLPAQVDVTGEVEADVPLESALAFLDTTDIQPAVRARVAELTRALGDTCLRIDDHLKAPSLHTRVVWVRAGDDVAERTSTLADALGVLPAHREKLTAHVATGKPWAIGVRATPRSVLSELWLASRADAATATRVLGAPIAAPAFVECAYHREGVPFGVARLDRAPRTTEAWQLLRVWHVEVLSSVADRPNAIPLARTSYAVVPGHWRSLPANELSARVGVLVEASYARRNQQMAQTADPTPTWPIGFAHEWVGPHSTPAREPRDEAVTLTRSPVADAVVARALGEMKQLRAAARPGLDAQPWKAAFSAWSVDAQNDWKVLKHAERDAAFARLG